MKTKSTRLKVLHLPTLVGGNSWGLSRGEQSLNLDSTTLITSNYTNSLWKYKYDEILTLDSSNSLKQFFKILKFIFSIRKKYDVFHFNFGSTLFTAQYGISSLKPFLQHLELKLLSSKAKLFVTYNGCDARQKYLHMHRTRHAPHLCYHPTCSNGICNSGYIEKLKAKSIQIMSKYVKHMWSVNPDLLYFLPQKKSSFLPYTVQNFNQIVSFPKFDKKLKIIHAPTNRQIKGTEHILLAIKKLQNKYDNFELILIENIPHKEAIKIYLDSDLVIDQIFAGYYGALAVEVMLMGKPVIARISEEDLHFLPSQMGKDMLNTIINANPENIYYVLEKCINDRSFLKDRSRASIEYAQKWHNPKYVASITKEKYES